MSSVIQTIIIKGFRKYSHSLGPESIQFIESICEEHGFADDPAQIENAVEHLAKEYNQQDDATMKVSLSVLQRVYAGLQEKEEREANEEDDLLNIEDHLFFVDAYEMPAWHWSQSRSTFEKVAAPPTIAGSADSRITAVRDRYDVIKQTVLRNEHFSPSTLPSKLHDRLLNLRSTKQLLGRAGERFLLFGLLCYSKEGKLCLEDSDGKVELDFSQMGIPSEGLFTEGCFALVEGDYTDEEKLTVIALGHPPCERRDAALSIYGHIDFLGKGMATPLEDASESLRKRLQDEIPDTMIHCLSDVWLDHQDTYRALDALFSKCVLAAQAPSYDDMDEAPTVPLPKLFIFCGNFSTQGVGQGTSKEMQNYQEGFDRLADLIASYPQLLRQTHFVFVPGPLDLTANSVLPRRPLLSSVTSKLKAKLGNKAHFMSNPCRIKFCGQELVIFREDTMARMLRHLVGVKPDVEKDDLQRFLVQSIIDQSTLSPFTRNIQPVLPEFDYTLRLYPMPVAVILADKYQSYELTYEGCHVFNPGSFVGNAFEFYTYFPARRRSECSTVELEETQ
ncbi:epsilon DNA polymerase [Schizopora paradoxa]|uniref:DNA polymerase epsilon subunit n=1 Tax=Schizopora paradoxa TaxID=27342 RepID=A0A0H2SLT8_9AGAM|nr:epsilon DNA polymerase [Schizopora paradoxa]